MRATWAKWRTAALAAALAALLAGPPAWAAVTGVISGTAADVETGAALSGANVAVLGTGLATVTDARGRFTITNVPPGTYTVSVSLVGYRDQHISEVVVVQGQEARLEAALEPTVVEAIGAEAKVTAPRVSLRSDVTGAVYVVTAADEQMTLSQPNDRYQFPGLVFAQPGVVPDNTFYPHIRGARANQVGYFIDGIPITEPNANVFATNAVSVGLDRLELFTGGYPAEYGGYTGGIINQIVKRGDQVRGGLVEVGAGTPYDYGGLLLERGDVDGPLNWYYGLYTWHSQFNENLFTTECPVSSDHIAKVLYDLGERDRLTVLSLHGYARYLLPWERMWTFDPDLARWTTAPPGHDFGRQGHAVDSIALNRTVSPTAFWNLRVSRLRRFLHLELGDPYNAFWQRRDERMLVGQLDYQQQLGDHRIQAGLWQINSDNSSRFSVFGTQYSPFGLLDSVANNDTSNTQAYVEDRWRVGERLTLSLGGRYDRMVYRIPDADSVSLSEHSARAGLTYSFSPELLLRASAGRYVGFPRANLIAANYVPHPTENPDYADWGLTWDLLFFPSFPLRPQVDRMWDLGGEWKLDASTLLSATWFRRESRQMMQRWHGVQQDASGEWILDEAGNPIPSFALADFDPEAPVWFAANGTGTARGLELKLDRRLSGDLRAWLSYTYLKAKATSPEDNAYPFGYGFLDRTDPEGLAQEFPLDWSQRHTLALAARYTRGKLTVNPWAVYGSGFPYGQSGLDVGGSDPARVPNPYWDPEDPASPAELLVPENLTDPADPTSFIAPNSLRTGKNLTLSLNLSYDLGRGREAYLQIYNLLGRDDVTSYVLYHPRTGGVIGRIEDDRLYYVPFSRTPPRFVAFGLRQEF